MSTVLTSKLTPDTSVTWLRSFRAKLYSQQTHNFHNPLDSPQVTRRGYHRPWIKHEYVRYAANVPINNSYISTLWELYEISSFKNKLLLTILWRHFLLPHLRHISVT